MLTVGSVYITVLCGFQNVGRQQCSRRTPLQCSVDHPRDSAISFYQFTIIGTINRTALLSFFQFCGSIDFPRRGSVFRADCDRRVAFSGLVQSPYESPTLVARSKEPIRLNRCYIHNPTYYLPRIHCLYPCPQQYRTHSRSSSPIFYMMRLQLQYLTMNVIKRRPVKYSPDSQGSSKVVITGTSRGRQIEFRRRETATVRSTDPGTNTGSESGGC